MDAVAIVEDEVRAAIRRSGIDPLTDQSGVRALAEAVLADYDSRSAAGAMPPVPDPDQALRSVLDAVAGFGPLQAYLSDPQVEEIWFNRPDQVFVMRGGVSELTTTILSEDDVHLLVERMLKTSGRRLDISSPFVDAVLPDGSRLHVVIPDVTRRHWAVNIRKFVVRARRLDDLVRFATLTRQAAEFLAAAVTAGLNVLVSGGTQAGKTTLLNCLAAAIPARQRVISCEEVFELQLPVRDWAAMQCRQASLEGSGEIPLRRLVKEALRMRPDRLIVGEVREAECLDLLLAMNSGLPAMATIHANSAREAVLKMCTLPLLAGPNIGSAFVVPSVAASLDIVVHLGLDGDGRRRVREILALPGRAEGEVIETADVFTARQGLLVRADGFPPHADRFAAHGFDLTRLLTPEPQTRTGR